MQGADTCPHCNVVADVEPHGALGFTCLVCGGPRVVVDAGEHAVKLSAEAKAALKAAKSAHTKHLVLSAAGLSLLGMSALGLLVAGAVLLAASPGLLPTLLTLLACSAPLGGAFWALAGASRARAARGESLHSARAAAVADVQAALGPLEAERLAQLMRIDAEQAELLLAEASVTSLLAQAAPRLRVNEQLAAAAPSDEATTEADEPAPESARTRAER